MEKEYNKLEQKTKRSHSVSRKLVLEMRHLARKLNFKFTIAGITKDPTTLKMLDFAKEKGIPTIDT